MTGNLAPDFARGEESRVHIRISHASTNGVHEFIKLPCSDPLASDREHLGWG